MARRKRNPSAFQSASPLNLNSENTNAEWLECAAFKEIFLSALKEMKYTSHQNVVDKMKRKLSYTQCVQNTIESEGDISGDK